MIDFESLKSSVRLNKKGEYNILDLTIFLASIRFLKSGSELVRDNLNKINEVQNVLSNLGYGKWYRKETKKFKTFRWPVPHELLRD